MNIKRITQEDFFALARREESHFYDRKAVGIKADKIEKIAVAFGNADGGEFVIGIKDDKDEPNYMNRWCGVNKIEELNSYLQVLFNLQPNLDIRYEILSCSEYIGYILKVLVEKSPAVHKTSEGIIYQRYGAQSLPIKDSNKIMELNFAKGASSFEDLAMKEILPEQIIESTEINSFIKITFPKTDPLDFCINQNLFTYKEWEPRIASILLFHDNPVPIMPRKCSVKITRYATVEAEPERDHLDFQLSIEGPLYSLIKKSVTRISEIISSVKVFTADGLKKLEYPPEAIWEVFVNAVIHRDYSISDDIQVFIFDDRLEILSPGRLPGYVNVNNILEARYARNPKIVRTLNRYPDPPNKDMGEGLNTTFQKMQEWGLKSPEISEEGNYVKVILPHIPLAAPSILIFKFLTTSETITNYQGRTVTGIRSENSMKNEFYKLRDRGLLERVTGLVGAKSAWQLTQKGKDELKQNIS